MLRPALLLLGWWSVAQAAPAERETMLRDVDTDAVAAALELGAPLPDGSHLSARIERDRVLVTAGAPDAPALSIALVAALEAPEGTPVAAGTALIADPGPAPGALVADVLARLGRAPRIPWRTVSLWRLRGGPAGEALVQVAHLIERGEVSEARATLDAVDLAGPRERIRAAALRQRLGEPERARALLDGVEVRAPVNRALVAVVSGGDPDLAGVEADPCPYAEVAQALAFTGRREASLAVARSVRTADPGCGSAWVAEMEAALAVAAPDAADVAAAAVAATDDPAVIEGAAGVWTATGDPERAVRALEAVVGKGRYGPAILVGPFCRDRATMDRLLPELEARLADPVDTVARYLVGVAAHYRNEFERSNELLLALERRWPKDQRLQIYVAMNDFNLGNASAALHRLNEAARSQVVDLDVFYCRAEVVRDTDPALALADLRRTAALARAHPGHSPEKDARLEELMRALEGCIATGERPCGGPWEHPRRQGTVEASEVGGPPVAVLVGLGIVAVLVIVVAARRAR
ncbi:MAG: hypothetical protein AMXMBFR64_43760 [Myxococcales bacterium]